MAVPVVNLILEKGTDFEATFNVFGEDSDPLIFNNFVGVSKIRKYPTSPNSQAFTVSITASTGEVKIGMAKSITSLLDSGRNYYDVLLTSLTNNATFKVVEGSIIVSDTASL
jgi:hypothetical protein